MRVAGIKVKRRVLAIDSDTGLAWPSARLVWLGSKAPLLVLYHELGHILAEGGVVKSGWWGGVGGPYGRGYMLVEAAAWRWAIKTWQARGKPWGEEEKAIVRYYLGTYVKVRKVGAKTVGSLLT